MKKTRKLLAFSIIILSISWIYTTKYSPSQDSKIVSSKNKPTTNYQKQFNQYNQPEATNSITSESSVGRNIDELFIKYNHKSNRDEKLHLLSTIAFQISNLLDLTIKSSALSKLQKISTEETDTDVKSFAIINYARLGDSVSAYELLNSSLKQNIIDDDTYYSELARLALSEGISTGLRTKILKEISTTQSEYTAEVMFSIIPHSDPSSLTGEEIESLISYVDSKKPIFSQNPSTLGVSTATMYANWIFSSAILHTRTRNPDSISNYLVDYFKNGFTDPREALSLFLNNPLSNTRSSAGAENLEKILAKEVLRYAESHPDNQIIQSINIQSRMRN